MTATIHPTALVSPDARIGAGVSVGPFSIIHGNVSIGDGSDIDSHCEIGYPTPLAQGRRLTIGSGARIRSHSVFYEGSTFGDKLTTGHRVTVREGTEAGTHLQIGTLGDIQGTCRIGDHVRIHSNVFIGQHAWIGDFVWLFPHVVLTNDPHPPSEVRRGVTLRDYAAVAAMSVILPGVTVGRGALVAAHSSVRRDVDADTLVAGFPAKAICATSEIALKDGTGRPAYPWRRHLHRGYPDEVVAAWLAEFGNGVPQQP
jgi:acetyltransferase-like isoleucine patch superfamily enzyme